MAIFTVNLQNSDNCFESHWVSLVPTVFRRVVRPICVSFLPLEKSPGGFCFQVPFRIRFPKPPWNLFYSTILPVIAFLCLNEVITKSDNIWHQKQVGQFWDFSLIGQTLIAAMVMDASELPADFGKSVPEIRRSRQMSKSRSAVRSSENGFADDTESSKENSVCGLVNFSDDDTDSTASSPMPSPLRDWNVVRFHHSLIHGDPNSNRRRHMCLFNLYFLFFIIVIISSFAMVILDLLVSGNIYWYQQRHFLWPISPFGQRDWMTIQTPMSGQQIWVIGQRRLPTDQCESFPKSSNVLIPTKRQDTVLSPTTFSSHLKSKVMLKAFWSLSSKLIANNKYVKEGHNRFHLLACKAFDSRVTLHSFIEIVSISYICVQWLFCIYSVFCKLL